MKACRYPDCSLNTRVLGDPNLPLAAQVAAVLIGNRSGLPIDLGDTWVLTSTAGAARAIRRELARMGVLSPTFRMPMESLDPPGVRMASRMECEAAWAAVLDPHHRSEFAALVPMKVNLDVPVDRFGVATQICGVCDQLALAGCDPASAQSAKLLESDERRWYEIAALYERYARVLAKHGIEDPNAVRLRQAADPVVPEGLRRVVVACVPDVPPVVRRYLEAIVRSGVEVDVLVWSPSGQHEHLDAWGVPDAVWWKDHLPKIDDSSVIVENDPASEAGVLIDRAIEDGEAGFGLFSVAPESTGALAAELLRRGVTAYVPDGRPLAQSEAAAILFGWNELHRQGGMASLRTLRSLLQLPSFAAWFRSHAGSPCSTDEWLAACDMLVAKRLCETVDAATAWIQEAPNLGPRDQPMREHMRALVFTLRNLLNTPDQSPRNFLIDVFRSSPAPLGGSVQARELGVIADVMDAFEQSSLLASLEHGFKQAALSAEIRRSRVFHSAPEGAVEIQGWLEAPWSVAPLRIIAGCREGTLPAGTHDDAFLPDAVRKELGIPCQDARFAREAYLLSCLLTAPGRLLLGVSRFRAQGEPNRPSRLLFACDDHRLPARTSRLLRPTLPAKRPGLARMNDWLLTLPSMDRPIESISVTAFHSYLSCPLRFYLSHVLRLSDFDPEAREIHAGDFGSRIHQVLDRFGKNESCRDSDDELEISEFLDVALEDVMREEYGTRIPPVVRVQIESMRARLRAMARVQAQERAKGWRIIASETALSGKDDHVMRIGSLKLTGIIDRVEFNDDQGRLRILDYKTFGNVKMPRQTHLGPVRGTESVVRAVFASDDASSAWKELQLPLYRHMVPHLWPEHSGKQIEVGYFLLPADPDETKIESLELDDAMQASALACAEEIAQRVAQGVFWPPADEVDFDLFRDWFDGDSPAKFISQESIRMLGGVP
jgi:ATP-dependent helicase/nuclease subunit B